MTEHVHVGGLQVAKVLFDFVNNEAIPGTGLTADQFWAGADKVINDLAPKNKALLAKRDDLQARIDAWHQAQAGKAHDAGVALEEIEGVSQNLADLIQSISNAAQQQTTSAAQTHQGWHFGLGDERFATSPHVARGYSYKWSGVLASQAFEQFSRRGLFDAETGLAFRDAFFTYGDARSLRDSMEAFLGADKVDRFFPPSAALLRVDNTQDVATLIGQLTTSQQQMIELNDALPRPADIAAQHLKTWFKTTFPALADSVAVQDLFVRTLRETLIPQSDRVSDGPLFSRTISSSVPLNVLFWQAAAGRLNTGELFLNLQNIEIAHQTGNATQAPAALNSNDAKSALERLLVETRPLSFERQWGHALEQFWSKAAGFTQNRPVNEWLADQLSHQLMTQANLLALDGTLQEPLHLGVTDYALSAPEAEARANLLNVVVLRGKHHTIADRQTDPPPLRCVGQCVDTWPNGFEQVCACLCLGCRERVVCHAKVQRCSGAWVSHWKCSTAWRN